MVGKTLTAAISLSACISACALAAGPASAGHGAAFQAGGATLQRHFPQQGIGFEGLSRPGTGGRRFWPGHGLGAYPYLEPYAFPDYSDFEPICGFTWVDHIFGSRIVRHRVYTCS
jgi:hypothetical protein